MSFLRTTILQTCNQTNPFYSVFNAITNFKNWGIVNDDFNLYGDQFRSPNVASQNKNVSKKKTPKKVIMEEIAFEGQCNEKILSLQGLLDPETSDFSEQPACVHVLQLATDEMQEMGNQKDEIETVVSYTADQDEFFELGSTMFSQNNQEEQELSELDSQF